MAADNDVRNCRSGKFRDKLRAQEEERRDKMMKKCFTVAVLSPFLGVLEPVPLLLMLRFMMYRR